MHFAFHPEAESEYMESVAFYEGSQQGLGLRFVEAFEDAVKRILESPTTWQQFDGDIRRILVEKFPFGVLYSPETDYVLIVAVMHHSRKPGYWRERLSSK